MKPNLLIVLFCALYSLRAVAVDSPLIDFKYIDSFAINAPSSLVYNTDSIANYLRKGCKNDMEKARAAFTWVASNIRYDDNGFNSGNIPDQSPARVLKHKHAVCEGYADLYAAIAKALGLEAVKVIGHAKAYGYRPGERFENKRSNHAWNAVKIDGQWRLLDATWGAGASDGERGKLVSRKQFTPYWFNVDKYEFIFQHYPIEQQWTLLTEALTIRQYEEMPRVRESFFIMGFNAADIFTRYLAKTLPKELPIAYTNTHPLKLIDFPLDGILAPTDKVKFTIVSEEDLVFAISNDLKQPPVFMTKSGNQYTATLSLKKGDLHIAIGQKGTRFSDILLYKVK